MIKRNIQFVVLALIVSLTSTIVANVDVVAETIPKEEYNANLVPIGTLGMDWTLQEVISGSPMSFSSFAGKVVLLDFFATWCVPCKDFVPKLKEVKAQFSTNQLIIISIDIDPDRDDIATIRTFAEDEGMNWYIFIDTKGITSFYEIKSIPTFYILNGDQRVTYVRGGSADASTIISEINKLVYGVQTTIPSSGGPISDFWSKSWYWFVIIGVFLIIAVAIFIQRVKVKNYNKKVQQQRLEEKQRRIRKRWR